MTRSRILGLVAVLAAAAIATGAYLFFFVFDSIPIEDRLKMARAEHRAGDYEAATELVDGVLIDAPDLVEARALSAQISIDARDDAAADIQISWLAANTAADTVNLAVNFAKQISKRYLDASQVDGAEKWFARVLEIDPDDGETTRLMADLLTDQGRRWEAYPLLVRLLKSGNAELMQLILVARTEGMMALDADYVAQRYADRGQVGPLLGLVRYGIATNGHKTAEELVHQVIAKRPEIIEARIRLCEIVLEVRPNEFAATIEDVPASAVEHPDYWTLLGKWYRRKNEPAFAVACFYQSLKLDPDRTIATFQLSQLLERLGKADDAAAFRNRADILRDLASELTEFLSGGASLDRVHKVSDHLEELGRYRESVAWAQNASQQGRLPWATKRISELGAFITDDAPLVMPDKNPANRLNESDWPLPTADDFKRVAATADAPSGSDEFSAIQLTNVAGELGLDFQYFNGAVADSVEHLMYEFTGGGVGVIDYDLDGLPEFYLPNGTRWPPRKQQGEFRDGFYRNQQTEFVDVANLAGLIESGFGQGVAVGDFNCDGFPDIYVANTNRNQLWQNNGDGTFDDVSDTVGLTESVWTTSCAIVDLNADGLPDIYDANFLTGDDVFTRVCDANGKPRSCPPAGFPGELDCVWLNRGDGTFENVTKAAGIVSERSNSLGIIAADFDGSRKLNLFLANDSVPNFYYQNQSTSTSIVFNEAAVLSGLDVDYAGKPQACMGVGVADLDSNGLLDLFITNFHNESNALYLQQVENAFSDECRPSNVRATSQDMLGFGTQFLDVDSDGYEDVVITNGHVDDFTHEGTEYQMRPQILRRVDNTAIRFVEQKPDSPDAYFSAKHLGRGLARLDFNRDGLNDYGVSHLDSPFALVRNDTQAHGNYVSVRLVATATARDAIGAVVRLTNGDRVLTRQLTAGDGYMASNERRLTIGLGVDSNAYTVEVDWMSGHTESFGSITVNSRTVLVEGLGRSLAEPQ